MREERGTGTVAQRGLRVSRGKACGVWRAFRIARLSRGRTRATKECGGTGAVGQRHQGCEYGHCACPRQRGSVHLELDRQWGRWGRAVLSFQRGARGAREGREIVETWGCVSSINHHRLAALHSIISALLLKPYATSHCGVLGSTVILAVQRRVSALSR
eukprot:scaffold108106_cov90-Phaeocystis_antarctica.AAC.1